MVRRLLIVEDNPLWADLLCRYASEINAKTRVVVSPGQALELIDEWQPHAISLDMLLAGETGIALLQEIKSHQDLANIPIIVCSGVELSTDDMAPFGVSFVLDKGAMTPSIVRKTLKKALGYESE